MDKNDQSKILAVIEFTPLKDLTQTERDKINSVTSFLYKTKQFVNSVSSSSRSWGGYMWVIGWRKSSTAFELIGRYLNQDAINLAPDVYEAVMKLSEGISDILGNMFHKLSDVAFKDTQTLMLKNHIPGFASLEFDAPLNKNDCSPNLTFTTSGFFNPPHVDSKDISEFAFVLFVPININDGTLVSESDDYSVTGGDFVFPYYNCGIDFSEEVGIVKMVWRAKEVRHCTLPSIDTPFHTRMGMSLQINQKL
ncbi:hypothetical protein PCANC_18482 [Puccinia coronata f. sp. avenae]|uniref:Tet-like 2OG-Fe(II) oxygenase domain-containing protein n=1 Tax=Puccinia coronata f. sp. avenae TaxID=200324 RepID=A0A2N5T1F7_9BASI|nr:hypothetical protein PCANC_18482 [Puccinia coronata f. sp. avenae]